MIINSYTMEPPTPTPLPITPIDSLDGKVVLFYDYDGTVVAAYTAEEFANLEALPENPSHTGLVAQGWNWTRANIASRLQVCQDAPICVGQEYITESGATEIDIVLTNERKSPYLAFCVNGEVSIDWGDNTATETITGSSSEVQQSVQHTYASGGSYTISITFVSGDQYTFRRYGSADYPLLCEHISPGSSSVNYTATDVVKNIRLGYRSNIGVNAFSGCIGLSTITMHGSLTRLWGSTFSSCSSLRFVTIPHQVNTLDDYAFKNCYNLFAISLPNMLNQFSGGKELFNGCRALKHITLEDGFNIIKESTFYGCSSLQKINAYYISEVQREAFRECGALTHIPDQRLSSVQNYAFVGCNALTSIDLSRIRSGSGSYGEILGSNSLSGTMIESVTISSYVNKIDSYTFNNCRALKSVTFLGDITSIDTRAFSSCALQSITIPSTVTAIGTLAFADCDKLQSITIPDGVKVVQNGTFSGCYSLTTVMLPSTITSIASTAFDGCYGIKAFHIEATLPPTLESTALRHLSQDCVIYIPYSADHSILDAYQTATNWATFASQMQEEPQ